MPRSEDRQVRGGGPRMQDSHTPVPADETTDPDRLRLVGTATLGLAERLAGRLDGHLARFAEHMREGLLAASTAVGLEVMAELMAAEVTDLAGPKGKHDPARVAKRHGSEQGTVTLGAGGCRSAARGPARSATTSTSCPWSRTRPSPRPTCWPAGWLPGCWAGCRPAATRSGSSPSGHSGSAAGRPAVAGGVPGRLRDGRAPAGRRARGDRRRHQGPPGCGRGHHREQGGLPPGW